MNTALEHPAAAGAAAIPSTTATSTTSSTTAPSLASAPVTSLQAGMLFHTRLAPGGGDDVEQLTIELHEILDVDRFVASWQQAVAQHPMLRTRFVVAGRDEPVQETLPTWTIPVVVADWRDRDAGAARARFLDDDRATPFPFDDAPPQRLFIAREADDRSWACWTFHHALLDGRSFAVVLADVFAAYDGRAVPSPPSSPEFADFARWQRAREHAASRPFWQTLLADKTAPTPLPPLPVPASKASGHGEAVRVFTAATVAAARALAARTGTSLGTVLQAAWALVLERTTGDDDVVFGVTRAGRRGFALEHGVEPAAVDAIAGLFIQTVPVRAKVVDDESVDAFLRRLRRQALDVRPHETTPLTEIQGASAVPRGTPLLSTLLMFDDRELNATLRATSPSFAHRRFHTVEQPTFPLVLTAFVVDDGQPDGARLEARLLFARARFTAAGVDRLLGWLEHVVVSLSSAATTGDVRLLPDDERATVLFAPNRTARPYPGDVLVHELFEAQVDARRAAGTQHDVAVVCRDATGHEDAATFADVEARANRLAWHLRSLGARPGVYVGVLLPRGVDLVIALVAVAKSGAAWVPLDPDYPAARLAVMLEDTAAPLVVTAAALQSRLPSSTSAVVLDAAAVQRDLAAASSTRPPRAARPTDVAYTIFTSGSTGRPKGVVVTHEAVVNTLDHVVREQGFTTGDRLLFVTSACFDLSIFDVFGTLGAGASIRVAHGADLADPARLAALLAAGDVTVWDSAPAALARLVPELEHAQVGPDDSRRKGLRLVMLSGDFIPVGLPAQLRAIFAPQLAVVALGGATEASIWSNWYVVEEVDPRWTTIPYGRPIQNSHYHVLDRRRQPVPPGVTGELYIGGTCLAQGYLGRPTLTAERFVDDPFDAEARARGIARPGHRGAGGLDAPRKLYRTGDLARYFDDDGPLAGQIEFLGRADFQVKIRGFRVELGEVEATIARIPGVRDVVCAARKDASGEKVLVAWVVPDGSAVVDGRVVKDDLAQRLPAFMVPTHVVVLTAGLPTSSNGKVDRGALPDPTITTTAKASRLPSTPTEEALLPVWREVLRAPALGVDDDFFDHGGHSLLATMLVRRVQDRLGVRVPLSRLFSAPTVAQLARVVDDERAAVGALRRDARSHHAGDEGATPGEPRRGVGVGDGARGARVPVLVPLRSTARGTPVVFIAGVGGHVFTFRPIAARLPDATSAWGLRAIGSEGGETPLASIEQIAAAYEDELDSHGLLDGPIVLAGYSFGGVVAYELALRLQARGIQPAGVALFDTLAPGYPPRLPLRARARLHVDELRRGDGRGRRAWVRARVENLRRRAHALLGTLDRVADEPDGAEHLDDERRAALRRLWGASTLAQERYRPARALDAPGLLFRAAEPMRWSATEFNDPAHGWGTWLKRGVDVVVVPGAHLALFHGDNPGTMADAIGALAKNARQ